MLELKYLLQSPVIIIMGSLVMCGLISSIIGWYKKQSIIVSFLLGVMVGPIGWFIVLFNKNKDTLKEDSVRLKEILNATKPDVLLDEIQYFVSMISYHIRTLRIEVCIAKFGLAGMLIFGFIFFVSIADIGGFVGKTVSDKAFFISLLLALLSYFAVKKIKKWPYKKIIVGITILIIICGFVGINSNNIIGTTAKLLSAILLMIAIPPYCISGILAGLSTNRLYYLVTQKNYSNRTGADLFSEDTIEIAENVLHKLKEKALSFNKA